VNRFFLSVSLILLFFSGSAQDISGFWKGTLTIPGGCFPQNYIELQLTVTGEKVKGDSYHYLDQNNFIKKKCSGTYIPGSKTIIVQEEMVTEQKIPEFCGICIKKYVFVYRLEGNQETLNGGWTGTILESGTVCTPGTIILSRIKESFFKEEHVKEIKVDTGSIRLEFYDNGQIDGDSITILVNKKVAVSGQVLGIKPIGMDVHIDLDNKMQEVEMVAENLGSIPPNTALLVIKSGTQQHRLYLTSTEIKSAKVRFIYDGKQQE
jgi:hypothetical protein